MKCGRGSETAIAIRQWYNKASIFMAGTLFVVATPIGNLEDITARALRVLREVALIAAEDTRRTAHLLAHFGIGTPTTSLHEHNERQKAARLVERLQGGEHVALVSDAGTPTVSDPGLYLIRSAIAAGIRVEAVPGPSAVMTLLAASGLPAETFTFLGFPPARSTARKAWFEKLRTLTGTAVFFEAPHRIHKTLEELEQTIGDQTIVIGRELTKAHEELVRGPISEVSRRLSSVRGEFSVALELGVLPNKRPAGAAPASDIVTEFGQLTNNNAVTRRAAISELAKRHRLSARTIYSMLENSKKSGE
jgi:16S rRNA (cytidine1402-2'-O)-methyltransferase